MCTHLDTFLSLSAKDKHKTQDFNDDTEKTLLL